MQALDEGADDCLGSSFALGELLARVRVLVRRNGPAEASRLVCGDLVLDTATRSVCRGDRSIELSSREYAVLEYLTRRPGRVVTRPMLEEHVWGMDYDGVSNVTDVYVYRLRRKVDRRGEESLIQTVVGAGYRLRAP